MRGAVQQAIAELGKVDILVANAGILPRMPLSDVTDKVSPNLLSTSKQREPLS